MKKLLILLSMVHLLSVAQGQKSKDSLVYKFSPVADLPATSVKDQYRSGTCWAFSGLSFIESELIRIGKGTHDLAEMYLIYHDYHKRAIDFVRWHGAKNFGGGAESNNVFDRIAESGIVPENVYPGLNYGEPKHVHAELDAVLESFVKTIIENNNRKLSTAWLDGFDGILDAYLGDLPETFKYQEKTFTPTAFRDALNIIPENYIEIGSFTHHPFYSQFIMEVPDNWSLGKVYNVPMGEMLEVAYYALDNGYTILWGSDVSEKGFSHKNGLAIVPQDEIAEMADSEQQKWESLSEKERQKQLYSFKEIVPEKEITQEMRQKAFDNYTTTDDHGMHITGYATDQNGQKYFKVKNSWGSDNLYGGYFYASEPWFLYKTLSIMVHKEAIPKDIAKKIGL